MSAKITVQDALSQAEQSLFPRIATLASSASSFQAGDGVDKAMKIHTEALLVKDGMEKLLPYAANVQRPVSVADGNKIIAIVKDLQNSVNIIVDNSIKKKELLDALPVGNITQLIAQDMKVNHQTMLSLTNALLELAPAEILSEGRRLQKEIDETIKKGLTVYQ